MAVSHLESPSPIPGQITKMEFSRQAQLQTVRPCWLCFLLFTLWDTFHFVISTWPPSSDSRTAVCSTSQQRGTTQHISAAGA